MTVTWTFRLHSDLKSSFHIGYPVVRTERVRTHDYRDSSDA